MEKKLKIAYIIDGLRYGGKERQLAEIIRFLPKYIEAYVFYFKNEKAFQNTFIKHSREQISLIRNFKTDYNPFFKLFTALKKYKINLIHTFDTLSTLYALIPSKILRIPLIDGSIRDTGVNRGFDYVLKKICFKLADGIIANSEAGKNYYKVKNSYLLYNILDINRFKKNQGKSNTIVMNANFSIYKDHMTFFKATERLINENLIDEIVLIGDGLYKKKYEKMVSKYAKKDKFKFLGNINNVEYVISNCNIGVLCSTQKYSEGISNSILEYMGCGIPVVASDTGGTSEIIKHEVNGLLFEPENQNDLYNCIKLLLRDPRLKEKLISNAFITLRNKFSPIKNIKHLIHIYNNVPTNN